MKNLILLLVFLIFSISAFSQNKSAGNVFKSTKMFTKEGKAFTLGSNKSMNVILESFKAYNALDLEKYLSFYVMTNDQKELQKKWFNSLNKVEENPWIVLPLRLEGTKEEVVLVIAEEKRDYKNGSKEKLYVVELNKINEDGKLTEFSQFRSRPWTNEFGLPEGGRVYLSNGDTTTLTLTNRGEVELVEKFKAAVNKMDGKACMEFFADSVTIVGDNGKMSRLSKNFWLNYFDNIQSINWRVSSILPTKITDTDPESGINIRSRTKTVLKNGSIDETSEIIFLLYDLNGKIASINTWKRPILKE
ncbi:MAG: hypothetical protein O3A55_07950 [Bacteroidetes bacterium]|nr:hypothetical protein [Bacteroidota bacterium]